MFHFCFSKVLTVERLTNKTKPSFMQIFVFLISFVRGMQDVYQHHIWLRKPRRDFRLPTSDFRLPTSDFRLQTSDFRLPTSDFRIAVRERNLPRPQSGFTGFAEFNQATFSFQADFIQPSVNCFHYDATLFLTSISKVICPLSYDFLTSPRINLWSLSSLNVVIPSCRTEIRRCLRTRDKFLSHSK